MVTRFPENPIISTRDVTPSVEGFKVECVMNPGAFSFQGKTWLLLRVAERPFQEEGVLSFPIMKNDGSTFVMKIDTADPDLDLSDKRKVTYQGKMYLTTLSHLRLMCSDDHKTFYEPTDITTKLFGEGELETFGIEDCRVSFFENKYHLTYTQVSENGVGVGLMITRDWKHFVKEGMILPPHNKDCALFEEKINNQYFCFHRPSGIGLGGNFMWIASSPDLKHWGGHTCILKTRPGMWDCGRVGAGASPIKTDKGWLAIYHGADFDDRYCLGAFLLDLEDPSKVLARSFMPIMEPTEPYELNGFFGNVVFTNGHVVEGDTIYLYYGASDEVICCATLSVSQILDELLVSEASHVSP